MSAALPGYWLRAGRTGGAGSSGGPANPILLPVCRSARRGPVGAARLRRRRCPTRHDPASITAAALLSHSSGIEAGGLNWRYGTTGEFAPADVPAHLAAYATASDGAFDYGNFGPVVYTAMAEKRTGEDWRDLLRSYVFRPLGLSRTSARPEDLPAAETARCHTRSQGLWRPLSKPAALFNAGGGMNTSPRDAARFLAAFTSYGRSTGRAISPAVLAKTYQPVFAARSGFFRLQAVGLRARVGPRNL